MAKQPSLAAQSGALQAAELKMPAIFQGPPPAVVGKKWPPYITFAHPRRSDEWSKLVAKFKNVGEGDMYFIGDELVRLDIAKLSLICCKQYWALTNATGELQKTSEVDMPGWKEHIEAVVLVYLPGRVSPANICFRTTKCPAGKTLSDALVAAQSPQWGEESDAHKWTMQIQQPFMRFFGEVTILPARTSKTSGLPYKPTACTIKPTGPDEWSVLKPFTENPESQVMLDKAAERYQARLNEVAQKAHVSS